jgi:PilZ domain-containing protein
MPRMSASALQRALAEGRRGANRYDIALTLRFAALRRGEALVTGYGESVNISRTGMLFRCDERLVIGDSLVIVLDWPVAAQDNEPLKLVVTGHAVRIRRGLVGMAIHTHRLLRERDLDKRLSVFSASSEKTPRARKATREPVVLIEDDDSVALLVSLVVTPQKWTIERADLEKAKAILESGVPSVSLLVTHSPELLDALKPGIPAILTLDENAPAEIPPQVAAHPLRTAVRRPLTDAALREVIGSLYDAKAHAPETGNSGASPWSQ